MSSDGSELDRLVKKAKAKAEEVKGEHKIVEQEDDKIIEESTTFEKLGVCSEICEAVTKMGYKHPSKI
jgi:ATP-dependent RNA helicase DDX47/RRP3